jgi:hypothetical protein
MTYSVYEPMCKYCKHFDVEQWLKNHSPEYWFGNGLMGGVSCAAFPYPETIPNEIYYDYLFDHRFPYPKDKGIRFELSLDIERYRKMGFNFPETLSDEEWLAERKNRIDQQFKHYDSQRRRGWMWPTQFPGSLLHNRFTRILVRVYRRFTRMFCRLFKIDLYPWEPPH